MTPLEKLGAAFGLHGRYASPVVDRRPVPAQRPAPAAGPAWRAELDALPEPTVHHRVARFLAGCAPVGTPEPDDGHPDPTATRSLWALPRRYGRVRLLCVRNATPGPDGLYEPVLLAVPADCTTPLEAVAWTYGLTPAEYRPARRV